MVDVMVSGFYRMPGIAMPLSFSALNLQPCLEFHSVWHDSQIMGMPSVRQFHDLLMSDLDFLKFHLKCCSLLRF